MCRLLLVLMALVLLAPGSNWEVEALPFRGGKCAIAIDSAGQPNIAFSAPAGWGHALRTDDTWTVSYPQTEELILELELNLDADGLPHIGYIEGRYTPPYLDSVRYACFDAKSWHFETVTGPGRYHSLSMVLARDGTPHMTFFEVRGDSGIMMYAYRAGDTWSLLTVPTEDSLKGWGYGSFTLDTADRPGFAISWYKDECAPGGWDSTWLAVLEYDGRDWHRFEADSGEGWGVYCFWQPKIRYDPGTNLFHITHRADWPYWERGVYVTGRGHNWRVERDVGVSVGNWWYDFVLHEGRPHIVCTSAMALLRYQWRWAGGWEQELVWDRDVSAVALAVDWEGRPYIVFTSWGPQADTLFYGRRLFVGIEEPEPVQPVSVACSPTIIRGSLNLPRMTNDQFPMTMLDISGRKVMDLQPGENDVRHLAPGVYFLRAKGSRIQGFEGSSVKVVIQR